MIKEGDRVLFIDKDLNAQYGVMEVWNIKGDYALCRYGDYVDFDIISVKLSELTNEKNNS